MKGTHYIKLKAPNYSYDLALERKISIIRGTGGTGKSVLVSTIDQINRGNISIINENKERLIILSGMDLDTAIGVIQNAHDSIIVVDEDSLWITTNKFAGAVNSSDNYFVIITRKLINTIPYSVHSIYRLNTDENKVHTLEKIYKGKEKMSNAPDKIICEDEKSGYILFNLIDTENNKVMTAKGRSNLLKIAEAECLANQDKVVAIFGDGAAFGSHIEQYMIFCNNYRMSGFLPESFEFLLLHSKIFENDIVVQDILKNPVENIESKYTSGEQFFTQVLKDAMGRLGLRYNKSTLSRCFVDRCCNRYNKCNGEIPEDYNKINDLIKQIPIDLSKIFIDEQFNLEMIKRNDKNKHYYEV